MVNLRKATAKEGLLETPASAEPVSSSVKWATSKGHPMRNQCDYACEAFSSYCFRMLIL